MNPLQQLIQLVNERLERMPLETLKQRLTGIILTNVLIAAVMLYTMVQMPVCAGCVDPITGIQGNCTWIQSIRNPAGAVLRSPNDFVVSDFENQVLSGDKRKIVSFEMTTDKTDCPEQVVCPFVPTCYCPPQPACPVYNSSPQQPVKLVTNNCPSYAGLQIPLQLQQDLITLRQNNPGASCQQSGWRIGKMDVLHLLGLAKTYNGQPIQDYYAPTNYSNNWANNSICFPDTSSDGSRTQFKLDTSRWWTNDKGSNVTLKWHSTRVPYNFSIYHQTDRFCWDFAQNITIDCADSLCWSDIWNFTVNCGTSACRGNGENATKPCEGGMP
jgi:hypothetical protein